MQARVLFTDPPWAVVDGRCDPAAATIERETLGPDVELRFAPYEGGRWRHDGEEFHRRLSGVDAVVIYRYEVDERLLEAAGSGLRVVARQGVGVDNLNARLLAEHGIPAVNVPDYCVDEVAAHTLGLLLALERGIVAQHQGLAGGTFDIYHGRMPRRLSRCTAGIVGFGRIGRAVARRLQTFYGDVRAFDPYVGPDLLEGYGVAPTDSLDELLECCDVVTLHCPLDAETTGMMGAAQFERMREGALLVNAARGRLVDPAALWDALEDGPLAGAALDVFVPEDPHEDEHYRAIVRRDDVVVTSHRAFLSAESARRTRVRTCEELLAVLTEGRPRYGRVDPPSPAGGAAR